MALSDLRWQPLALKTSLVFSPSFSFSSTFLQFRHCTFWIDLLTLWSTHSSLFITFVYLSGLCLLSFKITCIISKSLVFFSFFSFKQYFVYACHVYHEIDMCKSQDSLWESIQSFGHFSCDCWGLNLGFQEEHPVPLNHWAISLAPEVWSFWDQTTFFYFL